ncbi:MAG TPA: class I SAM-dependent methyltransferase [Patescibacteria group bacterium]|nr:class I SAM-dependent methyltransferase [Patescibacteria group bacterium]
MERTTAVALPQTEYTVDDFIAAFGAAAGERELIAAEAAPYDFRYDRLSQSERDAVILGILQRLDGFTQVGPARHTIWESAWSDVAQRYFDSGEDLAALDPPFMGATPVLRIGGDYARPHVAAFETHWFRVLRKWLLSRYLAGASRVCEFGCGSGFNLVTLAQMSPETELVGLDWSPSVVDLMNRIGTRHGFKLRGRRFDFFNPDPDFAFGGAGDVAMTFCALEQTGERYDVFVDWLMDRKPGLVVSMEPALELYDPSSLVDHMAIRYHSGRKYLNGYFSRIPQLAAAGKAEILLRRRLGFGSLYHEGYSLLIWRPIPQAGRDGG